MFNLSIIISLYLSKQFTIMEGFLLFFEELSNLQKFAWIIICMAIFWILEGLFPLIRFNYEKWKHAKVNLFLLLTTILINAGFGIATAGVFIWTQNNSIGLLHMITLPIWLEVLIGVMILDLIAQYVVHFLLHRIKFMWKFHMVHHSDTNVDVTTGTRHHPGDYVFRELFALIAIVAGGLPFGIYMVYRILTIVFTYWTHANLNMPVAIDKALSLIFITPNIHKFHHHFERPWTDTNFGNIFSLWDRMFGTLVYDDPHKITYGLDVLNPSTDEDVWFQFKIPFDKNVKTDY